MLARSGQTGYRIMTVFQNPNTDLVTINNGMADEQDGLHLEVLDMRAHVWGVEQDLQKVVKTGKSLVRSRSPLT